jgi:NhaA family Na+:H+ antiporter
MYATMIKRKIISPFHDFVKIESFSGILLMMTTVLALIWANSPAGDVYREIWQYNLGFSSEHFEINKPLIL